MANVLSTAKRVQIVAALVEGTGIRATARMADVSKDTVMKLWREIGLTCIRYMDGAFRDLPCKRLQVDEIWSFVYAKAKNVPADKRDTFGYGDVWTFTAIDAETKLMPSFLVGSRDTGCATEFMQDLASRLSNRVQLTTDGHRMYLQAVEDAFGGEIDFAQLHKVYANEPTGPETRYSPAECIGCEKKRVVGDPDPKHVSTSYVERANLTIRMSLRTFEGGTSPLGGRGDPKEGATSPKNGRTGPFEGATGPKEGGQRPFLGSAGPLKGRRRPREGPAVESRGERQPKLLKIKEQTSR